MQVPPPPPSFGPPKGPTGFGPPGKDFYVPPPREPKRRGVLLMCVLVMKTIAAFFALTGSILAMKQLSEMATILPEERALRQSLAKLILFAIGMATIEMVGLMGTWAWRRWGAFTLIVASILSGLTFVRTRDPALAGIELLSIALCAGAILMRWKDFE